MPTESRFLPGFAHRDVEADGVRIHLAAGGSGSPLLLLHGHPQTHVTWHKVAPRLAERFTVATPDPRGYGDSGKPDGGPDHVNYSKRAMAADQVAVMRTLGFDRFRVVGHDRGGWTTPGWWSAWPCSTSRPRRRCTPGRTWPSPPATSGGSS